MTFHNIEATAGEWIMRGRKIRWNLPHEFETHTVLDINADWADGQWFAFWIADCFDPPLYIVQHRSFEAAYEEFCDWQAEQLRIDESDVAERETDGTLSYSGSGVPIDTEAVQGEEVQLVALYAKGVK